jgi:hypothetical protein
MLPPQLSKLRQDLVNKGLRGRRADEDELLEELNFIDQNSALNEQWRTFSQRSVKAFGPSTGYCKECGKAI